MFLIFFYLIKEPFLPPLNQSQFMKLVKLLVIYKILFFLFKLIFFNSIQLIFKAAGNRGIWANRCEVCQWK